MPIYYSPSSEGFYDTDLVSYPSLPKDAIGISKEERDSFLTQMNANNKKLTLSDNKLVLVERVSPVTWNSIRDKRNQLLDNSDYTQIADFSGDNQAWSVYRQLLRDIPQKYQNPEDVIWPVKPNK
jgi:uncharacterized protein (DUF427 family)